MSIDSQHRAGQPFARLEALEELARLRRQSLISEEAFAARKAVLLAAVPARRPLAVPLGKAAMAAGLMTLGGVFAYVLMQPATTAQPTLSEPFPVASSAPAEAGMASAEPAPAMNQASRTSAVGMEDEAFDEDHHITAADVTGPFNAEQKDAIARWSNLESDCRGNYQEGITEQTCEQRDAALDQMRDLGVCWGREDQPEAEFEPHLCQPGSNGYSR